MNHHNQHPMKFTIENLPLPLLALFCASAIGAIVSDPPAEIVSGPQEMTGGIEEGQPYALLRRPILFPPITNSLYVNQKIEYAIAAITSGVVTNTTSGDNHSGCEICDGMGRHGWAIMHECNIKGPYVPATERWTTWTVTTDRQITMFIPGVKEALTFSHSTPITNWTVREVLKSEWVPKPPDQSVVPLSAPTGIKARVCPKSRMCEESPCPDCYGGHFRPCQVCGDSGMALLIAGSTEPPQSGKRDSTAGNEDAQTVEPAQSPNVTSEGPPPSRPESKQDAPGGSLH